MKGPLIILATMAAAVGPLAAQDLRARLTARIDQAVTEGFAGAVLVADRTGIVVQRSAGLADREAGVAVTERTVFDIGSVTKHFTRAAIAVLAADGRLGLDDPITRFFPDVPADKAGITVRHLLEMRAGTAEYLDREGEGGDFAPLSRADALRRLLDTPLTFAPGSARAYSNAGYTMLALIIEQVSGQTYEAFLRGRLLDPAGLTRTGFYHDQRRWSRADVAVGYGGRAHGARNSPWDWPEAQWALVGNGGMVSSPAELYRWIMAVRGGRVLRPEAVRTLYGGTPPAGPAGGDRPAVSYAGLNDFGFETIVWELFDGAGVVIVMTHAGFRSRSLAEDLAGLVLGRPVAAPRREVGVQGGPPAGGGAGRWGVPDSPRGRRVAQLLDMIDAGTPQAVDSFIADALDPAFRSRFPDAQHRTVLGRLQRELARPSLEDVTVEGGRVSIRIRSGASGATIPVRMELSGDMRIASLAIGEP